MNAQNSDNVKLADISDLLSYEDFQEIKQFVLDKGQRMTYCNRYNNNPFYEFEGNIQLFLNPIGQFPPEDKLNDPDMYDVIVIRIFEKSEDYPFRYTFIMEDKNGNRVYLNPDYDTEEDMVFRKSNIEKYIKPILSEIEQNRLNN